VVFFAPFDPKVDTSTDGCYKVDDWKKVDHVKGGKYADDPDKGIKFELTCLRLEAPPAEK
jgi:hypothetical protein